MSSSDYSYDEQVRLPCAGFFALPESFGHLSQFALAGWAGAVGAQDDDANHDASRPFRASSSLSSS